MAYAHTHQVRTEGLDLLRAWMAEQPGRTQSFIAAQLGLNQSSVSGWLRCVSRPEPEQRAALQLLTGIPQEAWLTDAERARLRAMRERLGDLPPADPPPLEGGNDEVRINLTPLGRKVVNGDE